MANAAEREGRLCLFVARSAFSLALQALHGTPQSEVTQRLRARSLCLFRIIPGGAYRLTTPSASTDYDKRIGN
ncbi:hypothetical protein Zmor_006610 [Zophobas morio]|uniref:Uncharacterized protein n=1 Tax=Zophobas morio TaxID=2755281 RepID=A0AA38IWB6_9CUCU|nr:hypothetical protein Zmor_006610 [Zophobas morio]